MWSCVESCVPLMIYALMCSSTFWRHLLMLGSIWAPIGIKRVPKVSQKATNMHQQTIRATCRLQKRKNDLHLMFCWRPLAPLVRFWVSISAPLDLGVSIRWAFLDVFGATATNWKKQTFVNNYTAKVEETKSIEKRQAKINKLINI